MKIFRARRTLIFLTLIFLLAGCVGKDAADKKNTQNSNTNSNASPAKDDLEEFGKIVNLAVMPEEVLWRESETKSGKKLVAVLKYSAADAQTLVANAEKLRPAIASELDAENWFPPELIAQSQGSGDEILKGKSYAANDFYSESYKNGKITRINDTDYFILELIDK